MARARETAKETAKLAAQLTDAPQVVRTYGLKDMQLIEGSKLADTPAGITVETNGVNGGWVAILRLADATPPGVNVARVSVKVDTGSMHVIMLYDGRPPEYEGQDLVVAAGAAQTLLIPLDTNGPPFLLFANANSEGSTTATIEKIEWVSPPSATPAQ